MKLQIKLKRYTTTFYLLFFNEKRNSAKNSIIKELSTSSKMVINSINVFMFLIKIDIQKSEKSDNNSCIYKQWST